MIIDCSPPNTVIGIETNVAPSTVSLELGIVALLIPSSVLKRFEIQFKMIHIGNCSPPNTVIGIETIFKICNDIFIDIQHFTTFEA